MNDVAQLDPMIVLPRLLLAMVVGGLIGYERRMYAKAIGVAGMVMVATGSTAYMLLSRQIALQDPAALGRAVQGILQGIGFLGGAVIFKGAPTSGASRPPPRSGSPGRSGLPLARRMVGGSACSSA